jgi:CBS domain-containing protein
MSIESIPVSSFMTRDVKTETEDQNIQAVCKTMSEDNIGSIVVLSLGDKEDQKPVGIITERDIVHTIGKLNPVLIHTPIKELMSKPLITLSLSGTIKDALQIMQQKDIRRIPIIDRTTMKGIITDKDIFRAILSNKIPLDDLVSQYATEEAHRLVFDQYREYFFNDILQRGIQ